MVKHVVKSHFRPRFLKSQGRKVLEPQRFFELRIIPGKSDRSAPKPGALPTGPHPDIKLKEKARCGQICGQENSTTVLTNFQRK